MLLYKLELRRLFSASINRWALALFIVMGLASIVLGAQHYKSLKISQIKAVKVFEYEREAVKKMTPMPETGSLAYSANLPTQWHLSAWSALFNGQSQAYLATVKLTALALQGQIYNREMLNPSQQKSGGFDLGFILVYLLPVLIAVLCITLVVDEREAGRWQLLKSLPNGGQRLLWRRLILRFSLVFSVQLLLLAVAVSLLGLWASAKLPVVVLWLFLYNIFWFLLAALIISVAKNMVFSSLSFIASWLLFAVLVPGAIHLYLNAQYQSGDDLQAALIQRMEMNSSWDGDQQQQLDQFVELYPEFIGTEPLQGKFHWKWYYAAQHLSDLSVDKYWQAYLAVNQDRADALQSISWLSPSLMFQYRLNGLAGSDGGSYLKYQRDVAQYHQRLREFYYPLLFNEQELSAEIIDAVPVFEPTVDTYRVDWRAVLLSTIVLLGMLWLLQWRFQALISKR